MSPCEVLERGVMKGRWYLDGTEMGQECHRVVATCRCVRPHVEHKSATGRGTVYYRRGHAFSAECARLFWSGTFPVFEINGSKGRNLFSIELFHARFWCLLLL
jgi:hypothetical protein